MTLVSTGILLYGPPGTGKSLLAAAAATHTGSAFVKIDSADVISKWQGESETRIKALFARARASAPCIIFIDEVDSLFTARSSEDTESTRRIKTQFLVEMNGARGVLVLAATNRPEEIDAAFRRRLQTRIHIALPECDARVGVIYKSLRGVEHDLGEEDFQRLGEQTEGYSGADVSELVRVALMHPITCMVEAGWLYFTRDGGGLHPHLDTPPCARCPMNLSSDPLHERSVADRTCAHCGSLFADLLGEETTNGVRAPRATRDDFDKALLVVKPSVSAADAERMLQWTREFGKGGG